MFCPNCGVKILNEAKFCFNCGNNIENIEERLKKPEGEEDSLIKENVLRQELKGNNEGKLLLCLEKKEENTKSIFDFDRELNEEKIEKQSKVQITFSEIKIQTIKIINEKLERKTRRMFSFDEEEFEERRAALSAYFKVPIREKILFIYDTNERKGEIEGILMTEKNIYMAGVLQKIDIVTIKEVKQVFHKDYALRIGKIFLAIRSEENTNNFCTCMLFIINLLKKIQNK